MDAKQQEFISNMNQLGKDRMPFLFIIDFDGMQPRVQPLSTIDAEEILYDINGLTNATGRFEALPDTIRFDKKPVPLQVYRKAFKRVMQHLLAGNSFLVNLTFRTEIQTNLSLKQIFFNSRAPYKLCYRNEFVVFSPEIFVRIEKGVISSHPMKGTIDSKVPEAEEKLLNNPKELAEHVTIVDLIRNDLSMMASDVRVAKFRYLDRIVTHDKELLQVSSKITGQLLPDYHARLGDIIWAMLPAGSVSGAPKPKTIDIIREAENYKRGYYTGIVGIFDGENVDCGVMIRFIEREGNRLFFKSGGGITAQSDLLTEYHELIDKVYVPIDRVCQST